MKPMVDYIRLSSALRQCLGEEVDLAKWLQDELELEKTAVYNRINGTVPFTASEFGHLVLQVPNLFQLYIAGEKSHTLGLIQVSGCSNELEFQIQLKRLLKLLGPLTEQIHEPLYYIARDLPYFFFLNSPVLLHYKLGHWMGEPIAVLQDETLSLARKVWDLYLRLATFELWNEHAFAIQSNQIAHDVALGKISDSHASKLQEELNKLQEQLKEWISVGKKPRAPVEYRFLPYMRLANGGFYTLPYRPTQFLGSLYGVTQFHLVQPAVVANLDEHFWREWKDGKKLPYWMGS